MSLKELASSSTRFVLCCGLSFQIFCSVFVTKIFLDLLNSSWGMIALSFLAPPFPRDRRESLVSSVFNFSELPKFHEDKLLLKSSASARPVALGFPGSQSVQSRKLASLVKKGLVVSVIPIGVEVTKERPMAMAGGGGMAAETVEEFYGQRYQFSS